jgi:hypothetical protein
MITVRLKGGMGNQMFQYAFGKRMAKSLNTELWLDLSQLLDRSRKGIVFRDYDLTIFRLKPRFIIRPSVLRTLYKLKSSSINNLVRKAAIGKRTHLKESQFHVQEELLSNPKDNTVYEGWWQSERYFEDISKEIREDFTFKNPILPKSKDLFNQINDTHSICLNVRRTDFLNTPNLNTTNQAYFLKSAEIMCEKLESPHFYIFSDDVKWCAENIKLNAPMTLVGHEVKGEKFGNYMQLMKACKHFIIPNSSFAWWAVWLNENPNKTVIAPKNWFNDLTIDTSDLVPKDWMRI